MKYFIDNIAIKDTKNGQSKYVELSLSDPDDFFNAPCIVPVFQDAVVKGYTRALEQAAQLSATNGKSVMDNIPEKLKWFPHAIWVTIPLPKPMYRRWGSEFQTTDPKTGAIVVHQPDDLVCDKSGHPKLYTEFRVLCKETVDKERMDAGYSVKEATQWANGWDPVSRGNSYISSFFVSAESASAPATQQPPVMQPAAQPAGQPLQGVVTMPGVAPMPAAAPGAIPTV